MKLWSKRKVKPGKQVKLRAPEEVFPQPDKPARPVKPAGPVKADDFLSKLTPEARAKLEADEKKIQEIVAFADENPEEASTVIRAWLAQNSDN
jgi:flagellar biosynthesis/type III secretory pathway M-ring protein FliF/YscJ